MKEVFPVYAQSPEARNYYNTVVHNAAAVLASEQFRRIVADASEPERNTAIFLTGVPGAGKTTFISERERLAPDVRIVYEGQLSSPASTIPKIQEAIEADLQIEIVVVHPSVFLSAFQNRGPWGQH